MSTADHPRRIARWSLACLLLAGLACDGGGTEPPVPTRIEVSPASADVELGGTLQLAAQVIDQRGEPYPATLSWSSSDPAVAEVDPGGRVTAGEPGTASITASSAQLQGTAMIRSVDVTPPVAQVVEPAAGSTVRDVVSIRIAAEDDHRVATATLLVDDQPVATRQAPPYLFQWNSLDVANGLRGIRAEVTDVSGNRSVSESVPVLVDNDGWIHVTVDGTPGFSRPFGIRFDDDEPIDVPIGGFVTSRPLRPGSHLVELPERTVTCAPRGERLRQVDVVGGDTLEVRFDVGCFVGRAYVAHNLQSTVGIVDSDAPEAVGETFSIGGSLRCIAGSPSRQKAWVVSLGSNRIQVLDTSTGGSLAVLNVSQPRCIAAHEGSGSVIASTLGDRLVFLDPDTDRIVDQITVSASPHRIAFDADGGLAYVTHTTVPGRISVVDTETRSVVRVLEVGTNPFGIAYDVFADRLLVANTGGTTLLAVDPSDGSVTGSAPVGVGPLDVVQSATGDRIYVVSSGSNAVAVLDGNLQAVGTIDVGGDPQEIAITADGRFLLTTNYDSDDLSLVDPVLGREIRRIPVGDGPTGLLLQGGG